MTPQEENARIQQQVNEELRAYMEAQRAATKETEKAGEVEAKVAGLTATGLQIMEKLYNAQLKYTLAMAKGQKGASQFNDGIDAMTEATQIAAVALSLLVPGGALVKGVVAGLTFLGTQAMKTAAEMQKAANEQADATYKAYSAFSKAGATGAKGMDGFFKDVNRMRLNVTQMDAVIGAVAASSKEISSFGGTVSKGAGEFADLVQGMGDFEKGMLNLGMNHDEQAEAVLGYMKIQSQLSLGQQRDYGKLSGSARKYIEETEILTRVTGLNRKEQENIRDRQMSQQRSGAAIEELLDQGKTGAVKLIQQQATVYAKMGPMAEQGYNDILSGHVQTEAAQKLMLATQGKVMQDQNDIIEGRITSERDAMQATQETAGVMGQMRKDMGGLAKAGVFEEIFIPFKEMGEAAKLKATDLATAVDAARKEVESLTGATDKTEAVTDKYTDLIKKQNDEMLATQRSLHGAFTTTGVGVDGFTEILKGTGKVLMDLGKKALELLGLMNAADNIEAYSEEGMLYGQGGAAESAPHPTDASGRLLSVAEIAKQSGVSAQQHNEQRPKNKIDSLVADFRSAIGITGPKPAPTTAPANTPPAPANTPPAAAPAPANTPPPVKPPAPVKYNEKPLQGSGAAPATNKSSIPVAEKPITKVIAGGDGETTVQVEDGSKQKRVGEASWRNNNPGNLRVAGFIQGQPGYVGQATNSVSGTFSVFKTREDGIKARYQMLFNNPKSEYYTADTSIRKAIYSYAPPKENNTEAYIRVITKALGLPDSTTLGQLNAGQKQAMGDAITQHEGKPTGKVLQAATGGVFDGPKSGYSATLHGMEAVIPLKDGAVPVSMSQEFNMTAANLGELVAIMKSNVDMQASMLAVLDEMRRSQNTTADNTGKMVAYASN